MNSELQRHSGSDSLARAVKQTVHGLCETSDNYAVEFVEAILAVARRFGVSDVHFQPTSNALSLSWRVDGVLQPLGIFSRDSASRVVTRLKVMADLLTYRCDIPQEGRLRDEADDHHVRVSTFPTLHGERATVRLFAPQQQFSRLSDLGLPLPVHDQVEQALTATSGMILVCGPAGSGKTTTLYTCLREMIATCPAARSIMTLEDPVEFTLEGVCQSQVAPVAGFDFVAGLRSLMRQDPEVIMIGEIRDAETATIAFQAALTGQLVLTSFHAGSVAEAASRLLDMGVAPYILRGALRTVTCQRLVRRLCDCRGSDQIVDEDGSKRGATNGAGLCQKCLGTGFAGRALLAEVLPIEVSECLRGLDEHTDSATLHSLAVECGMVSLEEEGQRAVAEGKTSASEIRRVLGPPAHESQVVAQ